MKQANDISTDLAQGYRLLEQSAAISKFKFSLIILLMSFMLGAIISINYTIAAYSDNIVNYIMEYIE